MQFLVMSRGMVYERRPSERSEADQAATGKSKTCVWRWQERFMAAGVPREKTRPPGTPRTPNEKVAEVIRLTQFAVAFGDRFVSQ